MQSLLDSSAVPASIIIRLHSSLHSLDLYEIRRTYISLVYSGPDDSSGPSMDHHRSDVRHDKVPRYTRSTTMLPYISNLNPIITIMPPLASQLEYNPHPSSQPQATTTHQRTP
jgi:hypothetical protein